LFATVHATVVARTPLGGSLALRSAWLLPLKCCLWRSGSYDKCDSISRSRKIEWLTQMENVLELLHEGVVIANDCHRVLFVSSRFAEMTGLPIENLIGVESSQFYSLQEWSFLTKQVDLAFRDGHNTYTFVLPRRDRGRLPATISSRTIENAGNRFVIMTFTDISEREHRGGASVRQHETQGTPDGNRGGLATCRTRPEKSGNKTSAARQNLL
jgi:PAS domain S-box-containing protein